MINGNSNTTNDVHIILPSTPLHQISNHNSTIGEAASTTASAGIVRQLVIGGGGGKSATIDLTADDDQQHGAPQALMMQTDSQSATTTCATNNNNNSPSINNNNNLTKNLHHAVTTSASAVNIIQTHFNSQPQPAQHQQFQVVQKSMSPAIGGHTVATAAATTGIVTMTNKTMNQATNIVTTGGAPGGGPTATTMLPASVQIVNVRPNAPTTVSQQQHHQQQQQLNAQKTVATVSPRVVIGSPHVVAQRPANAQQITLTQGPTLLLKTENGQYQLLRVGTAPSQGGVQQATIGGTNASIVTTGGPGNQTIRLQTVPATSGTSIVLNTAATTAATTTIIGAAQQQPTATILTASGGAPPIASVAPVPALATGSGTGVVSSSVGGGGGTTTVVVTTTPQQQTNQQNAKEKCRKFLANLLDLSSREPKSVEKNVRTLIQELIDANVEPEEFCDRLERLLNASPQPCLIGFLKKSLPVLRQSLFRKELSIDGVKPPPQNVAFPNATTIATTIPAMVRPIGQGLMPRMVSPAAARPGQTTIRHTTPVRIQGPRGITTVNQIRTTAVPALHPVSGTQLKAGQTTTVQIRTTGGVPTTIRPTGGLHLAGTNMSNITKVTGGAATTATAIKVGQTQIKQVTGTMPLANSNQVILSNNSSNRTPGITTIKPMGGATLVATGVMGTSLKSATEKEKKSSFYQHNSISSSTYGDDDINDVAAMGGVNLAEESQRILGSTELIGTQIRSCKDEVFLHLPALQAKIRSIAARHGLEEVNSDVAVLISHAVQERLKNIVEKLAFIAEHRIAPIRVDSRYEVTKDVRGQIKFLEELDKAEQKRHEEQEREMLLRAAKSRSKIEDPEQAKLKAKAKEMQRAEMEELRQRDANLTALQAIGQRKKPRLDSDATAATASGSTGLSTSGVSNTPLRPRIKRVNLRDMLFYLEQERETCRGVMLYKAYLK